MKIIQKKTRKYLLLGTVGVLSVFLVGFFVGQIVANNNSDTGLIDFGSILNTEDVNFSLVEKVWNLINTQYVNTEELDKEGLIYGAINGMLEALNDPYTVFFNKDETESFLTGISGSFDGIGIEIGIRDDFLTVISPLKNSPAQKAGIRAGDRIVGIDDQKVTEPLLEDAVSRIRGPRGSTVSLTVLRNEKDELNIKIIRDTIEVPSVSWELLEKNIAYIEISQFLEITGRDFSKVAQDILESDANSIVLDLRNNPGGFLDVAMDIAGWFLPKDEVVVTEELGNKTKRVHKSLGPGSLKDLPVVILANEGSASASEILAGALRDYSKAKIVGKKTFGKGSVQSLEKLEAGTSLKITVARWITPSGQYINSIGIEPDIEVEITQDGIDSQKARAVEEILNKL